VKVTSEKLRSDAHAAVDARVESGMTVGLESGATASWAVGRIGELLSSPELEVER
jgi:ribose 5-phosphate isomerase